MIHGTVNKNYKYTLKFKKTFHVTSISIFFPQRKNEKLSSDFSSYFSLIIFN